MYFAVTIDTEEDNWGDFTRSSYSVENIRRIPQLQGLFAARGVRPTYLITHPVATSPVAIEILGRYLDAGACEIGTHLHPWNTPPLEEERSPFNSYISHLPPALQLRKIRTLHETIEANFGVTPSSFRSGRWGFSDDVARSLIQLGYRVDTSVSPTLDWRPYEGPDYSAWTPQPFVYRTEASATGPGGALLEVPATVEFVQAPRAIASAVYRGIKGTLPLGDRILAGLRRLGALNRVCLSPELDELPHMIRLSRALLARGTKIVNMFFHSPTLLEGCSPYGRTAAEVGAFLRRIDGFLEFVQSTGLRPVTMSQVAAADVGASMVRTLPLRTSDVTYATNL